MLILNGKTILKVIENLKLPVIPKDRVQHCINEYEALSDGDKMKFLETIGAKV